jgi:Zn-dependent peptidase ImmA (M78 family)
MAIDLRTLGSKLSRYRQQLTESVDKVALATGIDSTRISAIEAGESTPSGDEVLILADHYLCDYKFFISNDQLAPFEQTETRYRAHGEDFSKSDRRGVQEFLYLCETEAFLSKELGRIHHDFQFTPSGSYYKKHGEEAALQLRSVLGYTELEVPRDVYAEFRKVGVHIFRRKLGNSGISGLFIMHPIADKCALVNYSEDLYRQRFSAAHEMAHAIFDVDQTANVSYLHPQGADLREVRANRFASCFLMPPAFLARLPNPSVWGESDALHWASELRVSCDALGVALKEAQLVDDQTSSWIRRLRVPRDEKLDPELPVTLSSSQKLRKAHLLQLGLSDSYVGLCFDALYEGVISVGRLAEALLCTPIELDELAAIYGRKPYGN